jgi:hypothetical protein
MKCSSSSKVLAEEEIILLRVCGRREGTVDAHTSNRVKELISRLHEVLRITAIDPSGGAVAAYLAG